MMEAYWPLAAAKPDASKHDKEHSSWYNRVHKIVISTSLTGRKFPNTSIVGEKVVQFISNLKGQTGTNIQLYGSPSLTRFLLENRLVDRMVLFVNPVILSQGIPFFPAGLSRMGMQLTVEKKFDCGVVSLDYQLRNL